MSQSQENCKVPFCSGEAQQLEAQSRVPGDMVGAGAQGQVVGVADAQHTSGPAIELSEDFAQAGAAEGMAVFIPPAILEEEQRVLDLPMAPDCGQQLAGGDRTRIEAGDEVAGVVRDEGAIGGDQVAIDAQRDATAGKAQPFLDIVGIV